MIERPEYFEHELMPGRRMFQCMRLSASTTVESCSSRWRAAEAGSSCAGCGIGRLHATGVDPASTAAPPRRKRQSSKSGVCPRCGGSGLRIIVSSCLCVSCKNREYEWIKGRNAKGKAPAMYTPPRPFEVGAELADGTMEIRIVTALHGAEAIARVARELPDGAKFAAAPLSRPWSSAWNAKAETHEYKCGRCGVAGLVLERARKGALERHSWCCQGDPHGDGWQIAQPRQPLLGLYPEAQAALMDGDFELEDETPEVWTPLPAWCASCRRGQLQGLLTAPGGRWRVKCDSCGSDSESGDAHLSSV